MYQTRLAALSALLSEASLDAVALNPGPAMTHLTGVKFHLMERPVVLFIAPDKDPALVLPELEAPKVDLFPYKASAFAYGETPSEWNDAFRRAAQALNLDGRRIGVEPRQLRLLEFQYLKSGAPAADFFDSGAILARLRLRKETAEVEAIRRAVEIAQDSLEAALPLIKLGMTERELASELTLQLFRHGSDPELPFAPIVSSGPNSANPHASPSDRKLQAGDMLVVDWGAAYHHYISDLTRTFAVGEADAEFKKIHKIAQEANAAGRAAGRPGAPCAAVDAAARAVIEKAGYGKYFTHRTGHGIGMEAHEDPYMRGDNTQALEPGMTYTVEPGVYLPNRNGVRIEDNLVITEDGAEALSDMPREIRVVG